MDAWATIANVAAVVGIISGGITIVWTIVSAIWWLRKRRGAPKHTQSPILPTSLLGTPSEEADWEAAFVLSAAIMVPSLLALPTSFVFDLVSRWVPEAGTIQVAIAFVSVVAILAGLIAGMLARQLWRQRIPVPAKLVFLSAGLASALFAGMLLAPISSLNNIGLTTVIPLTIGLGDFLWGQIGDSCTQQA